MRQNARHLKSVPIPKQTPSVDDELAEHLMQAEHHLIGAVNLFSRASRPVREGGYQKRLIGAQETITSLYRQELVRIRGPLRAPRIRKVGK